MLCATACVVQWCHYPYNLMPGCSPALKLRPSAALRMRICLFWEAVTAALALEMVQHIRSQVLDIPVFVMLTVLPSLWFSTCSP
jgi:hypothetical protein